MLGRVVLATTSLQTPSEKVFTSLKVQEHLMYNNIVFSDFSRIAKGWAKFVKATKLCLEWEITDREVEEIKKLFGDFVVHYERYVSDSFRICLQLFSGIKSS